MDSKQDFKYKSNIFVVPFLFIVTIWFVYFVEIKYGLNFNKFGIYPRHLKGLIGVFLSPFIHSNIEHLMNNSVPLYVLSISLLYFYDDSKTKVLVLGGLLSGLLTWCFGRESYHIGASGIVYLLFSFIFFSGIIKRHYRLIAMSLITIFLYGSMVWYVFPIDADISWEGHLSGFVVGMVLAYVYRKKGIVLEKHEFVKTDFDDMFDEHGNYVPPVLDEVKKEEVIKLPVKYKYVYKSSEEE